MWATLTRRQMVEIEIFSGIYEIPDVSKPRPDRDDAAAEQVSAFFAE